MAFIDINSGFVEHILSLGSGLQSHLLSIIFDLLIGILIIRLVVKVTRLLLKLTQVQTGLRYVITSIVETMLWIFLTITLLGELGFKEVLLPFAGSIALIGIVMAAGGSTLVSDIIAAVFLARDNDFNIGDEVRVGWDPVTQGVIERMDARRTRIRDSDGVLHVIPNAVVERKEWVVVNRRQELTAVVRATKTARRLGAAALEKRPNFKSKNRISHNNDQ